MSINSPCRILSLCALASLLANACVGEDSTSRPEATGGATTSAGGNSMNATGGSSAHGSTTGGASNHPSSGGTTNAGTSAVLGGAMSTGGSQVGGQNGGGSTNSGGSSTGGSASATGGTSALNTAATGGSSTLSGTGGGLVTGGTLGNLSTGGRTGIGGSSSIGATGGTSSTGGIASTGGTTSGASVTGGANATGGSSGGIGGTGGQSATGGTPTTGGSLATVGTLATGGAEATGGTLATGGTTATGGTFSTGGMGETGGTVSTGGIASMGGAAGAGNSAVGGCPGIGGPLMVLLPEGYCIDSTEVTRDEYAKWLATGPALPSSGDVNCGWKSAGSYDPNATCMADGHVCQGTGCGSHPQVCVDWCDAYAYCAAVEKHLCGRIGGGSNPFYDSNSAGSSQWFNACTSSGAYTYPYGSDYKSTACNSADSGLNTTIEVASRTTCQAPSGTAYAGVFDMSGNVWEWEDSCDSSGRTSVCRLRGASFVNYGAGVASLKCTADYGYITRETSAEYAAGFRCCAL